MHPDLLFSVIKNQAGTIGKAILELVMNSIDAGSTRVDIVWHTLISDAETVQRRLATYEELAEAITDQHMILPDGELTKGQMTALDSIRCAQYIVTCAMNAAVGIAFERRNLHAMRSDTAEAYTDGDQNIFIHEKFLNGKEHGPARAIAWAVRVVNLLVHEYLHSDNNNLGCTHDAEFHENFHEIAMHPELGNAVRYLFDTYSGRLKHLPGTVVRDLNRLAVIEHKLGAQETAPALEPKPPVESAMPVSKPKRTRREPHGYAEGADGDAVVPFYERSRAPMPDVVIVEGFILTAA
jgi:hypothetical protein